MPQLLTIHLTPGWTGGKAVGALRLRPERSDLHLPAPRFVQTKRWWRGMCIGVMSSDSFSSSNANFWAWHIGAPPRSRRAEMSSRGRGRARQRQTRRGVGVGFIHGPEGKPIHVRPGRE
jgi:hypothetical protein